MLSQYYQGDWMSHSKYPSILLFVNSAMYRHLNKGFTSFRVVTWEEREVNLPDWQKGIVIIGLSHVLHERMAHSVNEYCLIFLFLFVDYWKTVFLINIKHYSA